MRFYGCNFAATPSLDYFFEIRTFNGLSAFVTSFLFHDGDSFGFSRDDAGKFLDAYYGNKIYESDPFARLDTTGVGKLMDMAVTMGKKVRP